MHVLIYQSCFAYYFFEWNQINSHLPQNALYEGIEILTLVFGMTQFYRALLSFAWNYLWNIAINLKWFLVLNFFLKRIQVYLSGPQLLHIELHQQNCTKSIHRICAPSQLMIAMCNMCSLTFNTIDSKRNIAKV